MSAHATRVCSETFFGASARMSTESIQDKQPLVAQWLPKRGRETSSSCFDC